MKEFTLRTISGDGVLINESSIKFDANKSILIHKTPNNLTNESAFHIHNYIKEAIEKDYKVITVPEGTVFEVLEIN